jgi:dihydrofolate reductase
VRKLILYSAVSLDSRIARKNGDVSWLENKRFKIPGEDFGYSRFLAGVDTTIMGHNTYKLVLSFGGEFPYEGTTNYVITRSRTRRRNPHVRFVTAGIPELVRRLKRQKGRSIWLVGGSQINTLMLNHRLIDRLILTFVPVVVGEGIPLFAESVRPSSFILRRRRIFSNGFVQVTWDRK